MAHNAKVASTTMANMMNQLLVVLAAGGFIKIYTGRQPGTAGGAVDDSNVLLVTLALANPAFGYASSGVSTANTISPGTAVVNGEASWFRMFAADGVTALLDGTAGVGSTFVLNLSSTTITAGVPVTITSFVLNQPVGTPNVGIVATAANWMLFWIATAASGGFIEIYTGTQPATPDDGVSGGDILLGTLALGTPAFSLAVNGEITALPIAPSLVVADGSPAWFRMYESDSTTAILDGSCGAGEYDLVIESSNYVVGQKLQVASLVILQN
jgi:hypothetical protein